MEKLGYGSLSPIEEEKPLNVAFFGGRKEVLTEDEAEKLQEALEIHRMLKEKRMKEKNKK